MNTANEPVKLTHNEIIKEANPTLAGAIAGTLKDPGADRFSEDDVQFLKFHGIYQQDDRDLRKTGKKYMFMIRGRIPGGILAPEGYLRYDELATRYGNDTLRLTTRQSFQFHGVVKTGLGPLMKSLNEALLSTLAACGDVNRNVMAPATPVINGLGKRVHEDAQRVADALTPQTRAYHAIWVEGVELDLKDAADQDFVDPLYGKKYLPRKFKVAFAIPQLNDVDLFTNDLGFIAVEENGQLIGYNVTAGGGMGRSHGNQATFPRVADRLGFIRPEQVVEVAKAAVTIHRDFGDRTNRKHARLKYVLEERGVDWFRAEVEARAGIQFEPMRAFEFERQGDLLGWHRQHDGQLFLGLFVLSGRIKDAEGYRLKSALREIVEQFKPEVRLTPSQNIILADIAIENREAITRLLAEHGVPVDNQGTILRRAAMACPALPTCGLALAESERYLPNFLDQVEAVLGDLGLADQEIIIRMTGCPNGCARPYMAEIGLVGKAPGRYQIWLGGNVASTRLNRLHRDNVKEAELIGELRGLLERYQKERLGAERFGDWCERVLWPEAAVAA